MPEMLGVGASYGYVWGSAAFHPPPQDIPARRERLRVSELKQRDALNAADGVHTGGRALGWHTVRASVCLRNVSETIDLIQTREVGCYL